jgi:ribosomal protein RSM22 (predicted rRNA methylase)
MEILGCSEELINVIADINRRGIILAVYFKKEIILLLPQELQLALDGLVAEVPLGALQAAAQRLSLQYRERRFTPLSDVDRLAYLVTRLPATFQAIFQALSAVKKRAPHLEMKSLLDVGAGPGTGCWAAADVFPSLEKTTLLEKDSRFISLGKRLGMGAATWLQLDLQREFSVEPHDLVLASYSLGELREAALETVIKKLWNGTTQALVIIEPGTPAGFQTIRYVRELLISYGAHILAPCPHANKCPITEGDWCHFSARLQRTFHHRHAKEATMGYEDEKFSYIAAARIQADSEAAPRIVRHPIQQKGYVQFTACTDEGIKKVVVTRKNKELFRRAKKTNWGDSLS